MLLREKWVGGLGWPLSWPSAGGQSLESPREGEALLWHGVIHHGSDSLGEEKPVLYSFTSEVI